MLIKGFGATSPIGLFRIVLGLVVFTTCVVQAQMPPPRVEVIEIKAQEVRHWERYSGRISALESVDVRPQVTGQIEKVLFREGELVERGQPLFIIDPRPFEAAVKIAQASLTTATAQARLTGYELKRSQDLLADKLISQSIHDEALTADDIAKAAVLRAESQLMSANINLEYAHITAPISGRLGRAELTVGNIVGAGPGAPLLTTIVSDTRVFAEFQLDEQGYLKLRAGSPEGQQMPVALSVSNSVDSTYSGYLHAIDNQIDSETGTIRARAIFDNTDGNLIPGMFAEVRVGTAIEKGVYFVPERAVGTNQDRKFVYLVDDQNVVQYREITLGRQLKGLRTVVSGLSDGDKVVVNGLSRIRPQSLVEAVPATPSDEIVTSY